MKKELLVDTNVVLEIWNFSKKCLSIKAQKRVVDKISSGIGIVQALHQEGIMMCRFRGNVSSATEMAKNGELKISTEEPVRPKGVFKKAWQENKKIEELEERNEKEFLAQCDRPEAEIIKAFIPRPKNK